MGMFFVMNRLICNKAIRDFLCQASRKYLHKQFNLICCSVNPSLVVIFEIHIKKFVLRVQKKWFSDRIRCIGWARKNEFVGQKCVF